MSLIPGGNSYTIITGGTPTTLLSPATPFVFNPTPGNVEVPLPLITTPTITRNKQYRISWKGYWSITGAPNPNDYFQIYVTSVPAPLDDYRMTYYDFQTVKATGNSGGYYDMENIYMPSGAGSDSAPLTITIQASVVVPTQYTFTILSVNIQELSG